MTLAEATRREVEVKYQVRGANEVLAALAGRGVRFGEPVDQDDQAYAPSGWSYGQSKIGVPFARLRTQHGRHVWTVKVPVGNELDCDEHECEVSDRDQAHRALLAMGFRATVRLRKQRRLARVGAMSLCLDEIDQLGTFLEVELLIDGNDAAGAQAHMDVFVASLGLAARRVTQTYDSLLRDRDGLQ